MKRASQSKSAVEFREVDCVASLLRSDRASILQLEPGRLYTSQESLAAERVDFVRVRFSRSVRIGIERLPGAVIVVASTSSPAVRIDGAELHAGSAAVRAGGSTELVIPGSVTVSFIELADAFGVAVACLPGSRGTVIVPGAAVELSALIDDSFRSAKQASAPESIDGRSIERRVIDVVGRHLAPRDFGGAPPAKAATGAVALIETLVTNFLMTHEPVSVVEMCRITGLSRRALTYAFQKRYGVPPKRFFRNLALSAVRHELINSRGTAKVSDIAPFYGFWHMSQFAADYRNHFGELPSETIARARWERTH